MNPGDLVTCGDCRAEGRVWTSSPQRWREGEPLLITWTNGPHPRHESGRFPPKRCSWCDDRARGFPSVMGRPLAGELWTAGGPGCTYEIPAIGAGLQAPAQPAAESPLGRFEALAEAFHRETGMLAPGKDQPAAMGGSLTEAERSEHWRTWCAARAAGTAPKKKDPPPPRGQLGLLL